MNAFPTKILVATDFDTASERALEHAITIARRFETEIVLVHAYELPMVGFPDGTLLATAEMANRIIVDAETLLQKTVEAHKDSKVKITPVLRNGNPKDEILSTASAVGANLIVIGTHGRRGLARALIGSVAEQVIRTAPCAVLTVRAPAEP